MSREPRGAQHAMHQIGEDDVAVNQLVQQQAKQALTTLHRPLEQVGVLIGRPNFLLSFVGRFVLWVGSNLWVKWHGGAPWDEPPFSWLQGVTGLLALLVTTVVLATQSRQGQLTEQRSRPILQIALLIEQRGAKTIDLLEEVRRDLPSVHNRR